MGIRKFDFPGEKKKREPEKIVYNDKEKDINKAWNFLLREMEAQFQITLSGAQKVATLLEQTIIQIRKK